MMGALPVEPPLSVGGTGIISIVVPALAMLLPAPPLPFGAEGESPSVPAVPLTDELAGFALQPQ
jgi:hypothetical protein